MADDDVDPTEERYKEYRKEFARFKKNKRKEARDAKAHYGTHSKIEHTHETYEAPVKGHSEDTGSLSGTSVKYGRMEKGFYGHLTSDKFKKTSIIRTTGR